MQRTIADRYQLVRPLGAGGMGEVFLARDERLQRDVAIKLVRDEGEGQAYTTRALKEARAAAALNHPNIVVVHDFGAHDGAPFVVMELVEGVTLRSFIGRAEPPLARRVGWSITIARAMGAAHEAGLVHRDLKPDNVMIRKDGVVKVLDFGIAHRIRDTRAPLAPTSTHGLIVGTAAYMAPEQARATTVDARADQFAWAVLTYELLTGALPWTTGEGFAAMLAAVLNEDPVGPHRRFGVGSDAIDAALLRALAKSRDERFASIGEAADALDQALTGSNELALAATALRSDLPRVTPAVRIIDQHTPTSTPAAATSAFREAMRFFRDADWASARDALERAVAADPELGPAQLRLAFVLVFDPSHTADARAPFRRAVQLRETLSRKDAALLRGLEPLVSFEPPDRGEAARRLRAVCDEFPNDAEVHLTAAVVSVFDETDERIRLAKRAVELDPAYSDAWALLGHAYSRVGRLDDARQAFQAAIDASPHSVDAYVQLAALECERGDALATETAARRAIAIAPSVTAYTFLLGAVHARRGRPEALRSIANAMVAAATDEERPIVRARIDTSLAILRGDLANANEHAERWASAVARTNMMRVHAELARTRVGLALEQGELGRAADFAIDYLDGREVWRAARQPAGDATPECLAVARKAGRIDRAYATIQRAAFLERYSPQQRWATFALAYGPAIDDADALDEARAIWQELGPERSGLLEGLADLFPGSLGDSLVAHDAAHVFHALGEPELALRFARAAGRACLAPSDPIRCTQSQFFLAQLLIENGSRGEAAGALDVVLERWANTDLVTARRAGELRDGLGQ